MFNINDIVKGLSGFTEISRKEKCLYVRSKYCDKSKDISFTNKNTKTKTLGRNSVDTTEGEKQKYIYKQR